MFTRNVARSFPSGFPCCEAMEPRLLLAGDITITVTSQATADTTPDLSGTISDSLAAVKVRVAGTNYAAVNNGDGTWTLAGTELEAPLANGTYDVVALATNSASGAFGVDDTADELVINTISPIVAVNELVTNALRPALTGTVNDTLATVTVTVGGKTYTATNKKDGTWSLAANVLSVLSEGTYDVAVAATNTDGHVGTDTTADELTIDRTKPVVTVNTLATGSPSPRLTGTVDDPDATLVVTVNGKLYTPLNNADGTWTLAAGTISSLSVGHYDVAVTAFDDAGNTGADTTTNELDIQALPGVTMDALATPDTTPELTGSVSDPAASVSVAVDGHTYAAVNNGDGTWTLADDTIDPLADGNYDVVATAVLGAVSATDTSTYELVIDTADPVVTIDALTTTDTTPTLTGTVDAADETITVTVNGKEYTATNTGNGTWTLSGSSLTALTPGTYDVKVSAKDAAGNVGADSTTDELGIQPVVTVTSLTTTDTTPKLTGTVTSTTAAISVRVNGVDYAAVNNGNGTWTLADNTIAALTEGTYEVVATATIGSLSATDNTTKELSVDLTAPTVTIKAQDPTTSTRPAITGTVSESTATITVVVAGKTYTATNNANGTWTLAANTITALSAGTYTVTATAKDAAGNKSTATSTIQIVVLPTIKVNTLSTTDRTPKLTGTVDNPTVAISVTVNGVTYAAVNNGDGTWTLADNTVASLADGTYDVVATATVSTDLKSTDSTTGELVIDTTAPTVTVTSQETTDTTPDLAGTVTESGATVTVTVNGKKYTATNSSGKWTLAGTDLTALAPGVYDVTVSAKDAAGNVGTDATTDELTIVPVVTVNSLTTNDTTPKLSGTVTSSGATVTVTVDGVDYQAVNHGDGLWALADNTIAALAEGTYEVTVTATLGDLTATDSTVNELAIDTTAPGVTVTAQEPTTSTSPAITGTVGDEEATITVEVAHKTYTATNFTDGTWELSADTITALAAGTYTVTATAEDAAGNKATATSTIQIVVLPTIGVDTISTTDGTPELTGTISDPTAAITVTVNGVDYAAVNNGNGSWTLADNTVAELSEGVWEVVATVKVTDALESTASGELTIDTQAPEVTVDDLDTTETAPALTGTVTETGATVTVTIDSKDYTATNNGDGTWSLTLLGMKPGTYDVAVTAKDAAGNSGTDATTDELRVLPVVTIDSLSTNDTTPKLTGTVSSHTATVTVTVNGVDYTAVNNADTDNTWTLADNTVAALAEGTYDVTVTATLGTLTNTDDTVNELVIDTTAPGVTVKPVEASTETRPELSGTVGDSEATVTVMVANKNYAATNNGDGTWTLEADTISALAAGTRSVTVTAKDAAGNTATASTTIEVLNIPTVTIDSLVTSYNSPELTGTVDDPDATVWVVVNGSSFDATNNGDGTWTLAADTLSTLSVGTYDVAVYGVNTQSDWGIDQTSDELRIIAQTSVTMNYWGVRYVYYTDPDGTKVSVTIGTTSRRISGGLVLSFDSDAIVTTTTKPLGDTWYAMYLTCDAGVVVSGLNVYTATPSVTFKTAGGSISGSTIGGIAGSSVLTTLKAPTMTLIDNGIQMSTSAIQFIYLRSIQDADVTMAGLANGSVVFSIARSVSGSQISVTDGSIKSFSAGSLINSSVFVGVMGSTDSNGDTVYDLPVATDLRKGFSIGTLRVTGYSGATGDLFANSNIAVDSIGSVSLVAAGLSNRPDTDADGEPNDAHEAFGLTANSIKSLQLKQNKKSYRWIKGVWSGGFDPQDLTVRVS